MVTTGTWDERAGRRSLSRARARDRPTATPIDVADTKHTSSTAVGGIDLRNSCVRCMIPPFSLLA
jgi:hypothetical protein